MSTGPRLAGEAIRLQRTLREDLTARSVASARGICCLRVLHTPTIQGSTEQRSRRGGARPAPRTASVRRLGLPGADEARSPVHRLDVRQLRLDRHSAGRHAPTAGIISPSRLTWARPTPRTWPNPRRVRRSWASRPPSDHRYEQTVRRRLSPTSGRSAAYARRASRSSGRPSRDECARGQALVRSQLSGRSLLGECRSRVDEPWGAHPGPHAHAARWSSAGWPHPRETWSAATNSDVPCSSAQL